MHRYVWNLRYAPPPTRSCEYSSAAPISAGSHLVPQGPLVVPGEYEARLVVGEKEFSQKLVVERDPRVRATAADMVKQLELELQLDAGLAKTFETYSEIENVRGQLHTLSEQATAKAKPKEMTDVVGQAERRTDEIAGRKAEYPLLPTGFVELDRSLSSLAVLVGAADSAPTAQATAAYEAAQKRLAEQSAGWEKFKEQDLAALNDRLKTAGLGAIDPRNSGKAAGEQACPVCGCGGSSSSENDF
jgi:hypothetical protein